METLVIELAHAVGRGMEVMGIAAMVVGAIAATIGFGRAWQGDLEGAYRSYRPHLGRAILLGLEFLVAADIIGTVAVEPSFRNLGVLAVIVAIRTFLSFSLELEITGRWPWQDARRES